MSENITHAAVTDDCVRLALHSPAICRPFKLCLEKPLRPRRGSPTLAGRAERPTLKSIGVLQKRKKT